MAIQYNSSGRMLLAKDMFAKDVTFFWTDLTLVKYANDSPADIGALNVGDDVEITWVERDGKRMLQSIRRLR